MNEHDLHAAFGDLARRGADDQATRMRDGDGLSATEVTRRSRRARMRRAAASTVTGVVAVTGLVVGGSALADRPDPQPADTPTVTRPTPAPSPTPTGTPAEEPAEDADAADAGALPALEPTGLLRPYPVAPTTAWTTSGATLWPDPRGLGSTAPVLGDVTASPSVLGGFHAIATDDTWLLAVGDPLDTRLLGLDRGTGGVLWSRAWDAPDRVITCAGVHDGLLVCDGVLDGQHQLQLRDPRTGDLVRTVLPLEDGSGIALAGDAVVVHRSVDRDVHVTVVGLADGTVRAEQVFPGLASDPDQVAGDGSVRWETAGDLVRIDGYSYALVVDARTGERVAPSLAVPTSVRADGWTAGYAADGSAHLIGPAGEDLPVDGAPAATPAVLAPDAGVTVPLLSGSDPDDGLPDRVRAFDPRTGAEVWSVAGVWGAQAVVGGAAVLSSDDELVAVDVATGAELWRSGAGEVVGFDGDRLVIAGTGALRAVTLEDGGEAWRLPLSGGVTLVGDTLAVTQEGGSLTALVP